MNHSITITPADNGFIINVAPMYDFMAAATEAQRERPQTFVEHNVGDVVSRLTELLLGNQQ